MSLLAGAFSRSPDRPLDDALCAALRRLISRSPDETGLSEYGDGRVYAVKLDVNAYGRPASITDDAGSFSLLTGAPLLSRDGVWDARPRDEDLSALHEQWLRGDWDGLAAADGSFSAVHYQPAAGRLWLLTDKLGIRPLHVWHDDDLVVFASALRVLEELDVVPKTMDVRAVMEVMSIGIPLGDRTPYADIFRLNAAEVVQVDESDVSRRQYWRWDELPIRERPDEVLAQELDEQFRRAVARRMGGDRSTISFLSGGMDSRAVVAALRQQDVMVHTFNFSAVGTQDRAFARLFAEKVGARHRPFDPQREPDVEVFSGTMAAAKRAHAGELVPAPERPGLVWSGDGGSVGIGHVYLTRAIVQQMRAGDVRGAVDRFIREQGANLPRALVKEPWLALADSVPRESILEELDDIRCADPGRAFHLFLMLNDQRRHLAPHLESLDLHRQEYALPFFDAGVVSCVLGSPVEPWLEHGVYAKWFDLLPEAARAVPWQTYPGHVPCPLPVPEGLEYQWDAKSHRSLRRMRRRALLRDAVRLLRAREFPGELIDRGRLLLATVAWKTRVRDTGYILRGASILQRYWAICGGAHAVVPRRARSRALSGV